MPDYTKKNLSSDVRNSAPDFNLPEGFEAHFAGESLGLSDAGMAYERAAAGQRQPFGHAHSEQEEVYVVIEGSGRIKLDDEVIELERLDAIRIGTGVMRCVEAGPDGIGILCFGAPPIANPAEEATFDPAFWGD
jgi:uncharacterized cupin superfamily protein